MTNQEALQPDETLTEEVIDSSDEGDLTLEGTKPTIKLDKNDRSLSEFHRWYTKGRIIVDPEWQRKYVWDRKRASRLVESFLIDLPVPVIYLAVNDDGKYEVIDGLQRLTSIFDYFENQYPLTGLEIKKDLLGRKFSDLEPDLQSKLEDATLRTFELSQTAPKDLMFIIFERLNTGGMALNDMEIRNCLYRGGLNDLLKELSQYEEFKNSAGQSGLDKRMADRTLILRYLAFYQMTYTKAKKGLKAFFNEFFTTYRNPTPEKIKEFRSSFKHSMRACQTVFGSKAFRLRRVHERGGGEWASRINASIFQVISVSFNNYDIGHITRSADSIFESYLDLIESDEKWVTSVTAATGDYARIEYAFETWQARLKEAVRNERTNDSTRLFTRSLKEEMFAEDNACSICGQKIIMINDAALDHHIQYWKGGETVPENARLAHRTCNLKRGKGV
jgi:uncharacterized protein with ParB-like and HNH nuclease domain